MAAINTIGETIGIRIKELRRSRNLTQRAFAERLNITKSTVSAYENGSRLPSYDVLLKIADSFHVTTDTLLGIGNKYCLDVTDLTPEQRNTLQNIVSVYSEYNKLTKPKNADYSKIRSDCRHQTQRTPLRLFFIWTHQQPAPHEEAAGCLSWFYWLSKFILPGPDDP